MSDGFPFKPQYEAVDWAKNTYKLKVLCNRCGTPIEWDDAIQYMTYESIAEQVFGKPVADVLVTKTIAIGHTVCQDCWNEVKANYE